MKKFAALLFLMTLLITPISAAEKNDCSELKKLSMAYVTCKSGNLKVGIQEKTKMKGNPFKSIIDYQKKAWSKKD